VGRDDCGSSQVVMAGLAAAADRGHVARLLRPGAACGAWDGEQPGGERGSRRGGRGGALAAAQQRQLHGLRDPFRFGVKHGHEPVTNFPLCVCTDTVENVKA